MSEGNVVQAFTDGSCLGNPGPGGWAAILRFGTAEKVLSGGYVRTTNNRMEIMAALFALEAIKRPCAVRVFTDSRYLCDAVGKNWLRGWQKNGWKTAGKKPVKNRDLWERLEPQLARHAVTFHWLEGHAGHPQNERADMLAREAASQEGLPPDIGFEQSPL
ncbi:ribonuclease H [Deltaproteobacteria bacterium]|nr:ribonuclease H [Deltaproteobacteria bacterium]